MISTYPWRVLDLQKMEVKPCIIMNRHSVVSPGDKHQIAELRRRLGRPIVVFLMRRRSQ